MRFIADSDAFIVKGIIAILMVLYDNKTADEILATDADAVFRQIGLESHLSPSRRNGLSAMNGRIKSIAKAYALIINLIIWCDFQKIPLYLPDKGNFFPRF